MKQIGHSEASLYRYASMGWPLTCGSLGNRISCGVRSGEWLLDPVAREARVLARPRKSCAVEDVGLVGDAGPELESAA